MFYLASGLQIGYDELLDMEHEERIKWVNMLRERDLAIEKENERLRKMMEKR